MLNMATKWQWRTSLIVFNSCQGLGAAFLVSSRSIGGVAFFTALRDHRPSVSGIETEDGLYDFISEGIETNRDLFGLLEFVTVECCSPDLLNDFSVIL
jgi:hypothetical protein